MKRLIILIVSFLTIGICARAETESSGNLYFEPTIGLTFTSRCGFNTGLAFGYHWNCGVDLSVSGNYQRMYCSGLFKGSIDVDYEFLHFAHSYPYVGVGTGFIASVPFNGYTVLHPILDYRIGYNFVIIDDICDIGINYGGECIFLMNYNATGYTGLQGAVLCHSLNLSLRLYINHKDR